MFLFLSSLLFVGANIPSLDQTNENSNCCVNMLEKESMDASVNNFNCSQLTKYGDERCNEIFGGGVCKWGQCIQTNKVCSRMPFYELHNDIMVDIGKCVGLCKQVSDDNSNICKASQYRYIDGKKSKIKIIDECKCSTCGVKDHISSVEIPMGRCVGDCESKDEHRLAGLIDNYIGIEPSNPSIQLLSSVPSICPLGIQQGFDHFVDNRCFVHTFSDIVNNDNCPIRTMVLDICIQAAPVSLTNTDSLRLGTNGNGLWGIGLPALNGGSWNPGDTLCQSFDLNYLGGGTSILNDVIMASHLDVLVQDDTAVDYLRLNILYEDCQKCLPVHHYVNTLYTHMGEQNFLHIRHCDCLDVKKCHYEDLDVTFYSGTIFEITLNKGQCLGKCQNGNLCNTKFKKRKIKSPIGVKFIDIVEECFC